jgi:hypothetical protein
MNVRDLEEPLAVGRRAGTVILYPASVLILDPVKLRSQLIDLTQGLIWRG